MPRNINEKKDAEILEYLKDHTYKQTAEQFKITETQVSRIKKRNEVTQPPTQKTESIPPVTPKLQSETQVQGPAIAASEEKEPEHPKPRIRREPAPEVLEYTASKLKAIAMEELADDPKKWENYLRQLPNIWGGTRKGGSGWSTGMLAAFDILAVALNKRARKGEAK
jgi:hypothetical protein